MKKYLFLTAALVNSLSTSAQTLPSSDAVSAVQKQYGIAPMKADCVLDKNDPFDPGAIMEVGKPNEIGLCADTGEFRVPVILSEDANTIKIANFRHAQRWWIATIPKKQIQEVYTQMPIFAVPPAGNVMNDVIRGYFKLATPSHVQTRIKFNPNNPIMLESQEPGKNERTTLTSFIVDPQPLSARGLPDSSQTMIIRFISQLDRGTESVALDYHQRVDQSELILTPEQRTHLLETAIHRSVRTGYKNLYSGTKNNCATETIALYDEAFPPKKKVSDVKIGLTSVFDPVVGPVHGALLERGLINDESAQYTLNDEVGDAGVNYTVQEKAMTHDPNLKALFDKNVKIVDPSPSAAAASAPASAASSAQ